VTGARGAARAILVGLLLLSGVLAGPGPSSAQLTDADVYVAEAVLAVEDKQWDKALGLLRQALEREPDHVEALYYTGVAYMGKRQPAAAIPVLERAQQKSPAEASIAYQLGLAHFALEQYERAAPILEDVFKRDPELESLGYYVGFLRYRAGRYKDALAAFRAGRTADPAIADLTRLYAGLSLQRLGLSAQAEAELSQIGQLRPASPLTGPAERLKGAIASSRDVARRFRAEIRAGAFYDDNAPAAPDQKANDPAVAALRRGGQRTTGEMFSLSLEYDWLRGGGWLGNAGFSFLGTHNNSLPDFDIQDYTGVLRVGRSVELFGLPAQAGGSYSYDYLVLDNDEFVQRQAASAFLAVTAAGRHLTILQGRIELKDYKEIPRPRPQESLDATNYLVGLAHFVRFDRDRHYVKAGYQADYDDTQGNNYAYVGHRFLVGAQYTLPWRDIRLAYDFDLHYRDYLHPNNLLPVGRPRLRERADFEYTNIARVEVPLPWFTRDQGFFVTAEYVGKIVESNLAAFEYHRNYTSIYFTWQY
jgi:Flp pilus assembly protein TadD